MLCISSMLCICIKTRLFKSAFNSSSICFVSKFYCRVHSTIYFHFNVMHLKDIIFRKECEKWPKFKIWAILVHYCQFWSYLNLKDHFVIWVERAFKKKKKKIDIEAQTERWKNIQKFSNLVIPLAHSCKNSFFLFFFWRF